MSVLVSLATVGIAGLSLVAALIFTITKLGKFRRPASWLLLGLSLWLIGMVSARFLTFFLVNTLGAAEFSRYALVISLISTITHALGLAFVVYAVFVDRDKAPPARSAPNTPIETQFRSKDDNPFSTPQAS